MDTSFAEFLGSLLSLVICMAAGFVCRKARVLNDGLTSGLSTLLIKVTMPCSMFMSMIRPFTQTLLLESMAAFFLSSAVFLAGGLFIFIVTRVMKTGETERKVWLFSLIFANVGYMGYPVIRAFLGEDAMIYASMTNASFNILTFTAGIKIFTGSFTGGSTKSAGNTLFKMLTTPAIAGIILGLIFFLTGLTPPGPLSNSLNMVGNMTTPLSMLIIGSLLAKNKLRSLLADARSLPVIALRLLVIPTLAWLLLSRFIDNPLLLGVLILMPAMPVATVTAIFAEQYGSGADSALASKMVVLSTLLSVLTLPVITLLMNI